MPRRFTFADAEHTAVSTFYHEQCLESKVPWIVAFAMQCLGGCQPLTRRCRAAAEIGFAIRASLGPPSQGQAMEPTRIPASARL